MNVQGLHELDQRGLSDYLWRRLRLEQPVDPPLGERFGPEPPEQILIQAWEQSGESPFRAALVEAVRDNLRRIVDLERSSGQPAWEDGVSDEQLASLAFLTAAIDCKELVDPLYRVIVSWSFSPDFGRRDFTPGQFHLLRTLAMLQDGGRLARFWEELWAKSPPSYRGLVIYGWARADPDEALGHLEELVDTGGSIDLPATLWGIIGAPEVGWPKFGGYAAKLPADKQQVVREALKEAGAEEQELKQLDPPAVLARDGVTGERARDYLAELRSGLDEATKCGDRGRIASLQGELGGIALEDGRLEEAETMMQSALAYHLDTGNKYKAMTAFWCLGNVALRLGKADRAFEQYGRCQLLAQELRDEAWQGLCLQNLLYFRSLRGDVGIPIQRAIDRATEIGDTKSADTIRANLSKLESRAAKS